jgi:hypothetical protein
MAAAATVLAEQTVALLALTVATVQTREQTAMASAVAAVTGDRTRVTAHQRDAHEREEHRERKAEETLHH